jgi:transcriptional regulator of acetoin/glycerol metabolism
MKTEPVKRLHINLEEQLLDVVPIRHGRDQSKLREGAGHQVIPPKSTELQEKKDIYKPKMTRDEYLKMRGKATESGSSVNTMKRSYQAADDSSILGEAEDFLNSPSRWREELRVQPKLVTPSHSKRSKISFNSHHNEIDFPSASSEQTGQFNQHNLKGLSRPESLVPATRHLAKEHAQIPRIEAKVPYNERNTRAPDQIPRGEPRVSSVEYYAEQGTRAVRMESNRKKSSTFAGKEARKAESEAAEAMLSRFTDIIVDAAPDVISSPSTPLHSALNRMLAAQSRIAEGRVEKPTKQRIV